MFKQIISTEKFKDYIMKGKELLKEKPLNPPRAFAKWVVQEFSLREGKTLLRENSSYTDLGREGKSIKLGFLVANKVPYNCREATDEELLDIDRDRRAKNVYPVPLSD